MPKKKKIEFHFTAPPTHLPFAKAIAQLNKDFETNEHAKRQSRREAYLSTMNKNRMRLKGLCGLLLIFMAGCCNSPRQLSPRYRSAYRWTIAHCRTPAEDTQARRLWQDYIEKKAAWEWAEYNPPSVTGFGHHENWSALNRMHAADKRVFEFVDTLK